MNEITGRKLGYRAVPCPLGVGNARLIQVKKPFGLAWDLLSRVKKPGGLAPAEPGDSIARRPSPQIRVRPYALALALVLVLALAVGAVYAQAGGGYDLTWNTVDTGGATFSTGGGYTLGGTAGQPDAAVWSGGGYTLSGGFWHAGVAGGTPGGESSVYLPVILSNR